LYRLIVWIGLVTVGGLRKREEGVERERERGPPNVIVGCVVRCVKVKLNGDSVFCGTCSPVIAAVEWIAWAKAFAFTQLIEAPIYRWLVPTHWGYALLASALTHPFVWFVFPWMSLRYDLDWTATMVWCEIFAVTVEAIFFRRVCKISWRRASLVSLLANGASVGLGLAVRAMTGLI